MSVVGFAAACFCVCMEALATNILRTIRICKALQGPYLFPETFFVHLCTIFLVIKERTTVKCKAIFAIERIFIGTAMNQAA